MKPLRKTGLFARLVAVAALIGRLSTKTVGVGNSGNRSILPAFLRSALRLVPGLRRRRGSPWNIDLNRAIDALGGTLKMVPRRGWRQLYLPTDTESSLDHTNGCIHLLIKVAARLNLSVEQVSEGVDMFITHETDEAAKKRDKPLISTGLMPRSRRGRIAFQLNVWKPPSRDAELKRMREEYERALPLIVRWVEKNVSEDSRPRWLQLVDDFHRVRGRVAEVDFEVHALQPAIRAVSLAIEFSELQGNGSEKFPPEAAEPWLRRADALITLAPLKEILNNLQGVIARLEQEREQRNV